ncbi:MAG: sigma factor, partial [Ktedonobacterales bacterium]
MRESGAFRAARPEPTSAATSATSAAVSAEDLELLRRLRQGDEAAFVTLVGRYHASLLRVALLYVRDRAVAEEVVQDTWVGVLRHLDSFEPRASLKTWMFRILVNRAKTSAQREGRSIPFSATWDALEEGDEPAMPA